MTRVICDRFNPTEEEMDAGIFYILCHINWGEVTEVDCEECEFNRGGR